MLMISFLPPVIVHQGKHVTEEMLYGIPPDWIVHVAHSGYMYRDGWFKAATKFVNAMDHMASNYVQ
eukprot:4517579-Ditylum_brightwellii.AAC.1